MCGRYTLVANAEAIRQLFRLPPFDERLVTPRYNIAPTQPMAIVRDGSRGREIVPVRWGFVPAWAKDPGDVPLLVMARAEGLAAKASFRNALLRRRCLIPASGFYEWQDRGRAARQPFLVRPRGGEILAFAGLWETFSGNDGAEIDTAAVITVPCNQCLRPLHGRMPAIIGPEDFERWLSPKTSAKEAQALLKPAPEELLGFAPVSTRVNAAANDDASLWAGVNAGEGQVGGEAPRQGELF
jgi:putative SOS response-associated peptidase YedK